MRSCVSIGQLQLGCDADMCLTSRLALCRSKTQGIALSLGDKLILKQKG